MALAENGNMGLGDLMLPNTYFKRKYRWSFLLKTPCGEVSENLVKISSRPQLDIEEQEINFLHGKMWIPGKASWQTMTVTYYDVTAGGNDISTLYKWLRTVYEFDQPAQLRQSSIRGGGGSGTGGGYAAQAFLYLYDGVGTPIETWTLRHVWPQSINFGDLDYSSSEELTVELTLRYSEVQFKPGACMGAIDGCAPVGCNGR